MAAKTEGKTLLAKITMFRDRTRPYYSEQKTHEPLASGIKIFCDNLRTVLVLD